ncbi:MAG: amidase [Acidimicrobiales bacterium]
MITAVAAGTSCRERVEAALAALEQTQPRLNAFTAARPDEALTEADALDQHQSRTGLLHGVPVVVKDLFDVAGLPTTGGCAAYRGRVAASDSAVVAALRSAGAVVIAKTNQHELGAGATGLVSCFGPVANPHDPGRIAGGSSSGSAAAVAARLVPLAIGSDTGGSIRIPASLCGVTGLRPTPGRISLTGAQPMSPGYDTAGPMAATAAECAVAFAALTGVTDPPPPARPENVAGVRIGLPRPYYELLHPDTRAAVEAAAARFEQLGAYVDWTDQPGLDPDFAGFRHVWADVAHHHRDLWDDPDVSDEVAALIEVGRSTSGIEYAASRAHADRLRRQYQDAFGYVDVVLTPATPYAAPPADRDEVAVTGGVLDVHRGGPSRLTVPVNEAAVPAVAFPAGVTTDGLPLGAQLIGPPQSDERVLALVAAYQLS